MFSFNSFSQDPTIPCDVKVTVLSRMEKSWFILVQRDVTSKWHLVAVNQTFYDAKVFEKKNAGQKYFRVNIMHDIEDVAKRLQLSVEDVRWEIFWLD